MVDAFFCDDASRDVVDIGFLRQVPARAPFGTTPFVQGRHKEKV